MSNVIILLLLCGDNVDLHQRLTLTLTLVLTMHKPSCNHIPTAFKPTNPAIKLAGDLFYYSTLLLSFNVMSFTFQYKLHKPPFVP